MFVFKLLSGRHRQDGLTYNEGDTFESPFDLDKKFKNKFQRMPDGTVVEKPFDEEPKAPKTPVEENEGEPVEDVENEESGDPQSLGVDTTAKFDPEASDLGVLVFRDNSHFWVTKKDSPSVPLHKHALNSKKAVNEFLTELETKNEG